MSAIRNAGADLGREPNRKLHLRHILCPIDFSQLTSASLTAASAFARARHAELRALHVMPSEGAAVPAGLGSLERQELMSRLRASLEEAAPSYSLVGAAVRQGDPATQILRFARAMPADLIVMGAPGADRPERPMGPVTAVVVSRSECPVLTVPTHHTIRPNKSGFFRRIVCAVDPSPSSASVIQQALSLAWEAHGHLTYVFVLSEGTSMRSEAARDRLLAAIPSEARSWSEIQVLVERGTAASKIVMMAEEFRADLVVIGAPRRWTSTTHAVLSRSLCPVLVTHDARPLPRPAIRRTRDRIHTAV